MKKSTWLMLSLSFVMLTGMVSTNLLLRESYLKINLDDPFKNYVNIPVKPFDVLQLNGGNSYAIHVRQADHFHIKVMKSRQTFLKDTAQGDTLSLVFTVPLNSQLREIHQLPVGVIIYLPRVRKISCDGTSLIIDTLLMKSLDLTLSGKSTAMLSHITLEFLFARVMNNSLLLFQKENKAGNLSLVISGDAAVSLKGIDFDKFSPEINDTGKMVFYRSSLQSLVK
jgi:hypothetical protein